VRIRHLEWGDVDAVVAIQAASPEIAQWNAPDYQRVAQGDMAGWVAAGGSAISPLAGFIVARRVADDLEILNLAVRKEARRQGVGSLLVAEALAWAKSYGAGRAILEVRASNEAALQFYRCHGFQPAGRRPRYYQSPAEDALLLAARLDAKLA